MCTHCSAAKKNAFMTLLKENPKLFKQRMDDMREEREFCFATHQLWVFGGCSLEVLPDDFDVIKFCVRSQSKLAKVVLELKLMEEAAADAGFEGLIM